MRNDDHGACADDLGGVSHRLGMVAAGVCDDSAFGFGRETFDGVIRPANLKRPDGLKIFGLEIQLVFLVVSRTQNERRANGDAFDAGLGLVEIG